MAATPKRFLMTNDLTSCPKDIQEELKKFQGIWKQVGYERDGLKEPADEQGSKPITTFAGNEFVVTLADGSIFQLREPSGSLRPAHRRL